MKRLRGMEVWMFLVVLAVIGGSVAVAVDLFYGVPNTFGPTAVAENAGYAGAAMGTQAYAYNYPGAEVSIDASGATPLVNLPQAGADGPMPPPVGVVLEATQVKDGGTNAFGQELTGAIGGLFPTDLVPGHHSPPPGGVDNGLAPGSTAGDGSPDQLAPGFSGQATYYVLFGPGSVSSYPYNSPPVFELYEDVPPGLDLDISQGNLKEEELDFDGAGPAVPPPTPSPSQFVNTVDGYPAPNNVSAAVDGSLFAAGFIDTAYATITFFDSTVIGSGGTGPNGGWVYRIDFSGKGRVTDGSIKDSLQTMEYGTAYDGGDINITFTATLYGEAFATDGSVPIGQDPFDTWDLRTGLAGNSGDASFTIIPVEPTAALGDFVWHDLDKDGIQDAGEPGVSGVTVNLYDCGPDGVGGTADDSLVATTVTDANGYYLFSGLTPGVWYHVEFVAPPDYQFTLQDQGADDALDSDADPTTGRAICTTLDPGETDLTWDAGLYMPTGGEGFTPGFWKQRQHLEYWVPTGYSPDDSYEAVFGVDLTGRLDGLTLLEGVKLGGGQERKLIRHSVAALLNAAHPDVDYAYTVAEVIAMVQNAFATGNYEDAAGLFETENEKGGDING